MLRALNKLGVDGPHPHIIRVIYNKLIAKITVNEEKVKNFL
jgi:hypothetical protein